MPRPPRKALHSPLRVFRAALACVVALCVSGAAHAALTEDRVLLLYNSQNAESLVIRDAYIALHPGVLEFDLNDPQVGPGQITRNTYLSRIRTPLLNHLAGTDDEGQPLAQRVIAIATTRGLPGRIAGADEFNISSSHASLESELTLIHQDLEAAGQSVFPRRYNGAVDNPYHALHGQPIDAYSRTAIAQQRPFQFVSPGAWRITGLTPGHIYLVCRLDSAPTPGGASALENTVALLRRSAGTQYIDPCATRVLLDEHGCANEQFDDDSFTSLFPGRDDFSFTASALSGAGLAVIHDETSTFITADMVGAPLAALGTYGENHSFNGCGQNPAGNGAYINTYDFARGAVFISYESFNGDSIVDGDGRQNQAQALDFIARGGSFTIAHTREPFTFAVADLEYLTQNLFLNGLSFAEAAYSAIPALSWQNTPVGDPLARVEIVEGAKIFDGNNDGAYDLKDLYAANERLGESICAGAIDGSLVVRLRDIVRTGENADMSAGRLLSGF